MTNFQQSPPVLRRGIVATTIVEHASQVVDNIVVRIATAGGSFVPFSGTRPSVAAVVVILKEDQVVHGLELSFQATGQCRSGQRVFYRCIGIMNIAWLIQVNSGQIEQTDRVTVVHLNGYFKVLLSLFEQRLCIGGDIVAKHTACGLRCIKLKQ